MARPRPDGREQDAGLPDVGPHQLQRDPRGAIAVWRNFRQDKQKGLQGYMNALRLGYMRTIPEIYQAAGIKFDFSRGYIKELMSFVKEELGKI